MPSIAPSILAADFSRLGELVREVVLGGADRIHIDVMDGHFVPNLSMGPVVVKGLRPVTTLPLEVHLMVAQPARFVESFRKAGADTLIVHHEVLGDPRPLIAEIRRLGARVGIAINPGTPVNVLEPYLAEIDLVVCMTVWPGFGGQAFLPESPGRIAALRELVDRVHPKCEIEVDGGIDLATAPVCAKAGATVFVAGTSIFGAKEGPREATAELTRRIAI
jgi:ribulose-phosphate 3-epimerase